MNDKTPMHTSEELVIYNKSGKLILFALLFVLAGVAMMYSGMSEEESSMIITIIGAVTILFFGLCLIYLIARAVNRKPALIINEEGITDHSSYVEGGLIRWHEIEDVTLYEMMNQRMIGIKLLNPDAFLSQQKGFKKLLMRANKGMVSAEVNISGSAISENLDKVYLIILKRWKTAKPMKPDSSS
ncbi:STM3941 family protein [Paenibacillus lemnae]|uniref:Uncharacterized protein n=1 Tax=Paenibacillus lemnae TaxID=1330551 RepID=A0A848M9I4_PAELE|nr:STM3941 family protein [Paenibacillus lemnae]NMO96553.1 hypothetical protein [Paenibacillus lemnae]